MTSHLEMALDGSKFLLHRALRKYGPGAFEWKMLMCSDDPDDLNESEIVTIRALKTKHPDGYNMTDGGEGGDTFGAKSEEEMDKLKEKMRKARTPEIRKRVADFHRGRKRSLKTRLAISQAVTGRTAHNKGKKTSPKVLARRKSTKGMKHSEETKAKISEALSGRRKTAEHRAKIGKAHKGRVRSPEHCAKLSTALKGRVPWNKGQRGVVRQTPEQLAANIERAKYRKRDVLGRLLPKEKAS